MKSVPFFRRTVTALALGMTSAQAGIVSVTETNVAPDGAAVIGFQFDEEALSYHDRTHQHNGVAFDEFTGLPSAAGTDIVGLPEYLIGGDYVLFDNDARDNANYSALVTTDTPSTFYVLIDTRINGLNFTVGKTNTTDPVLGGSLQWVIDGGWERMNTGISPNGQGDFTGIDESGDGIGPGMAINNFMAVYRFPSIATSVTVSNGRFPGNMISVVAVPTAPPPVPIVSYAASAISLPPGGSTQLTWLISPEALTASIDQGIGNILPLTDANGSGTINVSPTVNTTYTLTVGTSGGPATASVVVSVRPLSSFTSSRQRIDAGESVTLNWQVRPDATVSIEGIGSVDAQTDASGAGTITVKPAETRDYVLTAEAEEQTDTATIGVLIRPSGPSFALIDIGATGGRVEPGAVNGRTIGGAANNTSGDLFETELLSDTGVFFTLSLDSVAPDDFPLGTLDWRDRGDGPTLPLNRLGEDFVKNNSGMIRATLGQLPAGTYDVISYHADPDFSQSDNIRILVTDANGVAVDTMVTGDASWEGHPENTGAPAFANLTTGDVSRQEARFQITANGTDPVIIYFDGSLADLDTETPLSGLWLSQTGPRPVDDAWALIDIGADSGQLEPGSAGTAVVGAGNGLNGTNVGPVELLSRTGVPFSITLDNVDPTEIPVGGLDWRDRGDAADVPLARFAEDFVKNNAGMIRLTLTGLPAGSWEITSYHNDPTLSQSEQIRLLVTDADRTAADTGILADASFPEGDAGAPQINGLSTGFVNSRTGKITVRSNGTDDILLYYDGTLSLDPEVPLNGLRIESASPLVPPQIIAVNDMTYTVTGTTAAFSISFASEPGRTYSVFATPDPASWGAPLTTNLAATGSTTIFTESSIPTTTTRRYYQIRRNP